MSVGCKGGGRYQQMAVQYNRPSFIKAWQVISWVGMRKYYCKVSFMREIWTCPLQSLKFALECLKEFSFQQTEQHSCPQQT